MFTLFSQHTLPGKERLKAVFALFADGAALGAWPGPAAVLRSDGATIVANGPAGMLADALGFDGQDRLEPNLAAAIGAGFATTVTVDAPGSDGARLVFTVLPIEPGFSALVLGRDTALEFALRDALTESRQRYKDLVEICGDFCWETDPEGRFAFVSPRGALGYSADALVGRHPSTLVDDLYADGGELPFLATAEVEAVDVWVRRADGTAACLETTARPIVDAGVRRGARGVCRDVTVQREREAEFSRIDIRKRLAAYIMQIIHDEIEPTALFGAAARALMQAVGAGGCRLYRREAPGSFVPAGTAGDSAPPPAAADMLAHADSFHEPARDFRDGCAVLCVSTSFQHAVNGAVLLWRGPDDGDWSPDDSAVASDVAIQLGVAMEQMRIRIELETQSRTDGLTGLLNRRAFCDELERRLARSGRGATAGALFFVDLDNFKPVNDVLGHRKGDEALCAVADLLQANSRPGDLVARIGGDEFALWLDRTDHDAAVARARDLLTASASLAAYSGAPDQPLGVSIGVAVWSPENAETLDEMTARADSAMYEIKHGGKDGFRIAPAVGDAIVRGRKSA